MRKIVLLLAALLLAASASTDLCAQTAKIKIKKQYLNFPLGKGEKGALIMEDTNKKRVDYSTRFILRKVLCFPKIKGDVLSPKI